MFQAPSREGPLGAWVALGAWTGAILATVPVARRLLAIIGSHWDLNILRWLAIAIIVLSAALAVIYLHRRLRQLSWGRLAWLAGIVAIFIYLALRRMKAPSEAVHFVEYGVLGLLAFRAVSHHLRDRMAYVCAVLVGLFIGTMDEILQWLIPGRFWDMRDVAHNGVSVAMAQLAIAGGMQPPFIRGWISARSVRWLCSLIGTLLVVWGLCASNTPVAVSWYARRVPQLAFLLEQDHPMSEYGFRYMDPEFGRFYSRFRPDDLAYVDRVRGEEAGRIIDHFIRNDTYTNFLRHYTPASDPFVHEAMVHIYRRNHYRGVWWKYEAQPDLYRRHATVIWSENRILEKYFPHTLAGSGQAWPPHEVAVIEPYVRAERRYKSEVSRHLITRYSEVDIWRFIMALLILDLLALLIWGRESGKWARRVA